MTDLEMILIWTNITTVLIWTGFGIERYLSVKKARCNVPEKEIKK